jgi:uncharacterized protein (UPF0332 family)
MREFAAAEWERAKRSLASARQLAETDPDSSASRAYYSAFHAASALFALRGKSYSKHTAVRAAVHRDLVQTGVWSPEVGQAYDFLMTLRDLGDYGGPRHVATTNALEALERAESVLRAVQAVCSELG